MTFSLQTNQRTAARSASLFASILPELHECSALRTRLSTLFLLSAPVYAQLL